MNIELCSDGAVALAKTLKHCTLLEDLKLINCRITPEGAEAIAAGLKEISLTKFVSLTTLGIEVHLHYLKNFISMNCTSVVIILVQRAQKL